MTDQVIPHVIIEAHINATARLWRKLGGEPIVWSPAPLESVLRDEKFSAKNPVLRKVQFRQLIKNVRGGGDKPELVDDFRDCILEAKDKFKLGEDDRLKVVLVGSHTTLSSHDDAGGNQGEHHPIEIEPPYFAGNRIDRTYSGLALRVLESFGMLDIVWLADVDQTLKPTREISELPPVYHQLSTLAADALSRFPRKTDQNNELPKPTIPLIFYRATKDADWALYEEGERVATTTTKLLRDFGAWREEHACFDVVMVKMLDGDLSEYNPIDPPYLREYQIRRAAEVGIEKIFLDKRVGILQTVTGVAPSPPPVFAIEPPKTS